ncbi:MAG: PleD family two-component system response regulator [Myxococcaceae bacterium]
MSTTRKEVRQILEREGFHVLSAANGYEALDAISRCKGRCIVVLDLLMPKMDGFQFLTEQLKLPGGR